MNVFIATFSLNSSRFNDFQESQNKWVTHTYIAPVWVIRGKTKAISIHFYCYEKPSQLVCQIRMIHLCLSIVKGNKIFKWVYFYAITLFPFPSRCSGNFRIAFALLACLLKFLQNYRKAFQLTYDLVLTRLSVQAG